jgi:hypothetical protein
MVDKDDEVKTGSDEPSSEDVIAESQPEKCPKCGTPIQNDDAETCPKCGADLVPPAGLKVGRIIAIIVLLLILAAVGLAIWKM